MPLPENTHPASERLALKNRTIDKVPKNIVSVNFNHALLSLFDLLTHKDGTDGLSQKIGTELLLCPVYCLKTAQISHDYLVVRALVWLRMVRFIALYAYLRQSHILKWQI
jgi:hypothetical protein